MGAQRPAARRITSAIASTEDTPAAQPPPSDDLNDWAQDQLIQFTGEDPQYASTPAIYEVEILSAPAEFAHLVGLTASAEG